MFLKKYWNLNDLNEKKNSHTNCRQFKNKLKKKKEFLKLF